MIDSPAVTAALRLWDVSRRHHEQAWQLSQQGAREADSAVAGMIDAGLYPTEIAERLGITVHRVKVIAGRGASARAS